jgi:hypothetical protein
VKLPNDGISSAKDVLEDINDHDGDEDYVLDMYLKESPVIKCIAAGGHHSMILTTKGRLYTFGYNAHG